MQHIHEVAWGVKEGAHIAILKRRFRPEIYTNGLRNLDLMDKRSGKTDCICVPCTFFVCTYSLHLLNDAKDRIFLSYRVPLVTAKVSTGKLCSKIEVFVESMTFLDFC